MARIEIIGLDKVKEVFASLSEMDRQKFFADEFKPIARMVETSMRNHTPVYKGQYWKSSKYESRNHPRGTLRNSVGSKMGGNEIPVVWINLNRKRGVDAWYDHLVVGGHELKGGESIAPNPIVQKTWDAIGGAVASQLENRLKNKLKAMISA